MAARLLWSNNNNPLEPGRLQEFTGSSKESFVRLHFMESKNTLKHVHLNSFQMGEYQELGNYLASMVQQKKSLWHIVLQAAQH